MNMQQLLPCANLGLCVFHPGNRLPTVDTEAYKSIRNNQILVFSVFVLSNGHKCCNKTKRLHLTVCIWKRCHQSSSSSVCRQGLCSPIKIKYIKHWSHFLCHDKNITNPVMMTVSHCAYDWQGWYLRDDLDLSPDQILWPDDGIGPSLLFSLETNELTEKKGDMVQFTCAFSG